MSVERRPDRHTRPWRVRWREEGRNRARSFTRRRDAIAFDRQVRGRLEAGGGPDPGRLTLDDWIERWIDGHGAGWEASTLDQRAWTVDRHVSPHLGSVRLRDLGRSRLLTWRRDLLTAGASGHAINSAVRVLSAALTAAADDGLIGANPLLGMRAVPQPPRDRRPVPIEAVRALLGAMPAARDRRVVALMAFAGLRPGEVRALRFDDLDEDQLWIGRAEGRGGTKRPKSASAGRVVPIRPELRPELERGGDGLVVPSPRGAVLDWHNWTARVWRPARDAVGIDHVPYELRHSYASLLIAEGASVVEVAAWMGHSNPATTLGHYARLFGRAREPGGRSAP